MIYMREQSMNWISLNVKKQALADKLLLELEWLDSLK